MNHKRHCRKESPQQLVNSGNTTTGKAGRASNSPPAASVAEQKQQALAYADKIKATLSSGAKVEKAAKILELWVNGAPATNKSKKAA